MPEKIHLVRGGKRPVFEVVEPEDGLSVTIRYAGNPKEKLTLLRAHLPALAETLKIIAAPDPGMPKCSRPAA